MIRKPVPKPKQMVKNTIPKPPAISNTITKPMPTASLVSNTITKPISTRTSASVQRRPIPKTTGSIAKVASNSVRKAIPNPSNGFMDGDSASSSGSAISNIISKPISSMLKASVKPQTKPTGAVKTRGGACPTFAKGSADAKSFNNAYSMAKSSGQSTFNRQGRSYNTK